MDQEEVRYQQKISSAYPLHDSCHRQSRQVPSYVTPPGETSSETVLSRAGKGMRRIPSDRVNSVSSRLTSAPESQRADNSHAMKGNCNCGTGRNF